MRNRRHHLRGACLAPLGLSTRELHDDITAEQAELLMNARKRQRYDVIRVAQGNRVSEVLGPPADLRDGEEEILIRMYGREHARQWAADWAGAPSSGTLLSGTAGSMTDLT